MNSFVSVIRRHRPGLIKAIVLAAIFILAGLGKLVAKLQQIPPPGQRPLPPRPAPPDADDEIEEFMRRAAQRQPARGTGPLAIQSSPVLAEPVRAQVIAKWPKKSPLADR